MFFHSYKLRHKPIIAGLNFFLTQGARGGEGQKLLGEKRDVKVWMNWLERRAHKEVGAIRTPIGLIPCYEDLKVLFGGIDKEYDRTLYDKQFALYVDKILARISLQRNAWSQEREFSWRLFEIYDEQRIELEALRAKYGPIVSVEQVKSEVASEQ
jgi:phosphoenolpyruvate carboxykinase (GTP)